MRILPGRATPDVVYASNDVAITLVVANTNITNAVLVSAAGGERLKIGFSVRADKGATLGLTLIDLNIQLTSGTWSFNGYPAAEKINAEASRIHTFTGFVFYTASGPGSLTITLRGSSQGSNSTVPIARGVLTIERFLPGTLF